MKALLLMVSFAALLVVGFTGYAQWPPEALPEGVKADSVLVLKSERKLVLLKEGHPLMTYRVALGGKPVGHKTQEGDGRTPEGRYVLDYRNNKSAYHLALHVSYPGPADRAEAAARGVSPGGLIMIHGSGPTMRVLGRWHRFIDWTDGCIAVTNQEIEQIWRAVPDGTPVEIRA
jgi:murein L,D-transpeptidase YafK